MEGPSGFMNNLPGGVPRPIRNNMLDAIENLQLNKCGPMGMKQFRKECEDKINIEEELSTPYIVVVSEKDRTIYEQQMAAFQHLDQTIVRYLCPNRKDTFKRDESLLKTIYCREKDCKFLVKLLLIGKVVKFKNCEYKITRGFGHWLIEFRKSQCSHLTLINKNLL
jgi:hypothetical protein